MVLVRQRTRLKNRIHATLAKYALRCDEVSDLFGVRGRALLRRQLEALPPHTAFATGLLLEQVEHLDSQVRALEERMHRVFQPTPLIQWLMTLPGVGFILAVVIALELGDIRRFPDAERFAAYAGTTPRVHASAGKTRHGPLRPDVNRYLKTFSGSCQAIFLERCRSCCRAIVARWYDSSYGIWRSHRTKMIFSHFAPNARSAWRWELPRARCAS